jgi:hypothetical protein
MKGRLSLESHLIYVLPIAIIITAENVMSIEREKQEQSIDLSPCHADVTQNEKIATNCLRFSVGLFVE